MTISWRQHELAKDDVRAAKIWLPKKFAKELRHGHEQEEPTGKDTDSGSRDIWACYKQWSDKSTFSIPSR